MGALEIRQRSVRLQNLGQVRSPTFDNGALRATQTLASANAGLGDSQRRIGEAVAGLGSSALKAALDLQDRADQNAADAFCAEYQRNLNAYNDGGDDGRGGRTQGVMAGTVGDTKRWLKDNERERKRIDDEARRNSGVNDRQYAIAKKRLFGYDEGILSRWRNKAAETERAREVGNANGRFEMARVAAMNLAKGVSVPADAKAAEQVWREYSDALEHKMDVSGILGDDQRKAARMTEAYSLCRASVARFVTGTTERATLAGADGDREFDESVKALEKTDATSFLPPSSWIAGEDGKRVNPLREALRDADMDTFRAAAIKDMKAARADWRASMRRSAVEGFANAQGDILAIPAPEDGDDLGQKTYQREISAAYRGIVARDGAVLKKFAPEKLAVAMRAIRGADAKADRARMRANGKIFEKAVAIGVPDPSAPGGHRLLSAAEKRDMAEFMYANDEIDYSAYSAAIKSASEKSSPLVKNFFQRVCKGLDAKFPSVCAWQADQMRFVFRDTKEANALKDAETGVETKVAWDDVVQGRAVNKVDREEEWTYGEYADAASLVAEKVVLAGPSKGESEAELLDRAEQEFRRLTVGTEEDVMRLSIKRRTEHYRQNVETLKNVRRGRMGVRWLPQGIELSRQTKAKAQNAAKKDEEGK